MTMRYPVDVGKPGAPAVVLTRSLVTGRPRLFVGGVEKDLDAHLCGCHVDLASGDTVEIRISKARWDGAECVHLDGRELWIARRLAWYEAFVALAPLVMIFGGAIPATLGAGALTANLKIIRTDWSLGARWFACAGIFLLTVAVAVAVAAWLVD